MRDLSPSQPNGVPCGRQSSQGITIPSPKRTTSSTGPMTLCGCRCGGCSCLSCSTRGYVTMPDPNREAYGGQGTSVDAISNNFSLLGASSFEAPIPRLVVAPPSMEMLSKLNDDTPAQLAEARAGKYLDDIDDAPWRQFVSEPNETADQPETSALFFGPMEGEGEDSSSIRNNQVSSSASRSMLSSYISATSRRSDRASADVKYAGAALASARSVHHGEPQDTFLTLN